MKKMFRLRPAQNFVDEIVFSAVISFAVIGVLECQPSFQ